MQMRVQKGNALQGKTKIGPMSKKRPRKLQGEPVGLTLIN